MNGDRRVLPTNLSQHAYASGAAVLRQRHHLLLFSLHLLSLHGHYPAAPTTAGAFSLPLVDVALRLHSGPQMSSL